MKTLTAIFLFISSLTFAQTQEAEIIYSGPGKAILEDGTIKEGELYHSRVTQRRVGFKSDGVEETFKSNEIKEFYINNLHFVKVQSAALGVKDPDFAIVKSSEGAQVKLYEVCWQHNIGKAIGNEAPQFTTYRDYYAQFPTQKQIKPLGDVTFIPFAKKVSKLVESCPPLSEKIAGKEKGYSIGLVASDEMKLEVFARISEDFENCK
jgi:hypothetical protein